MWLYGTRSHISQKIENNRTPIRSFVFSDFLANTWLRAVYNMCTDRDPTVSETTNLIHSPTHIFRWFGVYVKVVSETQTKSAIHKLFAESQVPVAFTIHIHTHNMPENFYRPNRRYIAIKSVISFDFRFPAIVHSIWIWWHCLRVYVCVCKCCVCGIADWNDNFDTIPIRINAEWLDSKSRVDWGNVFAHNGETAFNARTPTHTKKAVCRPN